MVKMEELGLEKLDGCDDHDQVDLIEQTVSDVSQVNTDREHCTQPYQQNDDGQYPFPPNHVSQSIQNDGVTAEGYTVTNECRENSVKPENGCNDQEELSSIHSVQAEVHRDHMNTPLKYKIHDMNNQAMGSPCSSNDNSIPNEGMNEESQGINEEPQSLEESRTSRRKNTPQKVSPEKTQRRSPRTSGARSSLLGRNTSTLRIPHDCLECGMKFPTAEKYRNHALKEHDLIMIYRCDVCDRRFRRADAVRDHYRLHTGEKPYECSVCPETFGNRSSLKNHLLSHADVKSFQCEICKLSFSKKAKLKQHLSSHQNKDSYVCACGVTFKELHSFREHQVDHEEGRKCHQCGLCFAAQDSYSLHNCGKIQTYTCQVCMVICGSLGEYNAHCYNHIEADPFLCSFCSMPFSSSKARDEHMPIHMAESPFKCQICGVCFKQSQSLSSHLQVSHSDELPFQCGICLKTFLSCSLLTEHMSSHATTVTHSISLATRISAALTPKLGNTFFSEENHDQVSEGEGKDVIKMEPSFEESAWESQDVTESLLEESGLASGLECSRSEDEVTLHEVSTPGVSDSLLNAVPLPQPVQPITIARRLGKVLAKAPKVKRIMACSFCDKPFKNRTSLKIHERNHTGERPFVCAVCNKSFNRKDSLINHQRIHTGEKPFKCQFCDMGFASNSALHTHKRSHSGVTPYKCSFPGCGKAYTMSLSLRQHIMIHTGEKPFLCPDCGYRTRRKGDLKIHMKIHSGEREHKCDQCPKAFLTATDLRKHVVIHTDERPHMCSICGKGFRQRGVLLNHINTHSDVKQFACSQCDKRFTLKTQLKRHMRGHEGIKPYECRLCMKRVSGVGNLKKHMAHNHGGAHSFECRYCHETFQRIRDCKEHMIALHPDSVLERAMESKHQAGVLLSVSGSLRQLGM